MYSIRHTLQKYGSIMNAIQLSYTPIKLPTNSNEYNYFNYR